MKPVLRAIQTFFPFAPSVKFALYNYGTRHFGRPMDAEFKLIGRMKPVRLVLDIGANWGQSIAAIKHCASPATIISFEPNLGLADRLKRVYAADPTVKVENCALGDTEGSFDLFVPRYRAYEFDGLASLSRDEAVNWLNPKRMAWFDPGKVSVDQQKVPVKVLDAFGLEPDVVKIDVQGAEHAVVLGGIETFRRCRPLSIIEEPTSALVDLFASFGMPAYGFDGERLSDGWRGHKNVVFASDERRAALGL